MLINEEKERREKLNYIKKHGYNFPNDFKPKNNFSDLTQRYKDYTRDQLFSLKICVSVAGRMTNKRIMGKSSFFILKDFEGEIQLYIQENLFALNFYKQFVKKWDLGDILGAKGKLFKTRTGELSIHCTEIKLLTKALKPLPSKFHGLSDQETRYRQRYLDLISNRTLCSIFKIRSLIFINIRKYMLKKKFLEVETPMMQNIPGGASARPFITHHNTLEIDLYLRISPELYLKRLIVGGFNKIFEINKSFRNEGISTRHNPEFTMMEVYMAYSNYHDMMNFTEKLLMFLVKEIVGNSQVKHGTNIIDFKKKFFRCTLKEAILKYNPSIRLSDLNDEVKMNKIVKKLGINVKKKLNAGQLILEIFNKTVEKKLIQPTFILDYPVEVSPLSRRSDVNKNVVDRFELFISGYEIGNGFSELNDADDQKKRFLMQCKLSHNINNLNKISSFDKHILYDSDYITALEYGLPPTSGLGIGIDRLTMLLTNQKSIRDVIFFPILKPSV
ncbi:lysyl-tRNA synthetase [Buchnera aphidicola str. Bp (Baizongia pistaciae)]|uniref:Lysine--tRNA ligase n=1 Tax=Buchnera aphidicola subsp. Baizongia pistaciae (strain Bp) TaxID=224915 RepID=SYK_BUCBP|nr:lysine--tRNA ligase [Buchnera aphidicola]Q89AC5.1 RecName: Full=Lysine--tRNA ligase; AltName: Full=Lysyl-tRNA synthetase; Short=LysRS [Buchnera aphidicola str. Bp (Baizongia pistaciae)]AAO27101.1 lysyl-tRNA synthetase [Buchnera aphidicola str. Bp (Baizongia pistaciae)]